MYKYMHSNIQARHKHDALPKFKVAKGKVLNDKEFLSVKTVLLITFLRYEKSIIPILMFAFSYFASSSDQKYHQFMQSYTSSCYSHLLSSIFKIA